MRRTAILALGAILAVVSVPVFLFVLAATYSTAWTSIHIFNVGSLRWLGTYGLWWFGIFCCMDYALSARRGKERTTIPGALVLGIATGVSSFIAAEMMSWGDPLRVIPLGAIALPHTTLLLLGFCWRMDMKQSRRTDH